MRRAGPSAIVRGKQQNWSKLMGLGSWWHYVVVILVVVLLFGRNKISDLMGDVARGVKSFKKGLADDDEAKTVEDKPAVTMDVEATREKSKAT